MALGVTDKENHSKIVVAEISSSETSRESSLTSVQEHQLPPVTDISWVGSQLACGTISGQVYSFNESDLSSPTILPKPKGNVPLGRVPTSPAVTRVALNPVQEGFLLSLENQNLHLWDLERTDLIRSQKISSARNWAVQWNPHSGNTLAIGGDSQSLKVIDLRALGVAGTMGPAVLKAGEAHLRAIRSLAWHRFVPHWMASGGDDGVVNVWDIRWLRRPVTQWTSHSQVITATPFLTDR